MKKKSRFSYGCTNSCTHDIRAEVLQLKSCDDTCVTLLKEKTRAINKCVH